jgi:hypothetical protein
VKGWLCSNIPSLRILDGEKVNVPTGEDLAKGEALLSIKENDEDDDVLCVFLRKSSRSSLSFGFRREEEDFIETAKSAKPSVEVQELRPQESTLKLNHGKEKPSGWGKNDEVSISCSSCHCSTKFKFNPGDY